MNLRTLLALVLVLVAPRMALADWPEKPIRFIVPFTAGSATDIIARAIADPMAHALGQSIVVENRPGAGGTVGAGVVAKANPDGYTLLVHSAGHVANATIYTHLPYDTLRDFAGVTPIAHLPAVLIVSPAKGYASVQDLVEKARANPGKLNYGSAGNGSATHMNAELFRLAAKFDAVHVPFRGTPEAMTETATGRIDFFFAPIASALPLIKEGRLKALAVGTAQRSPQLPDVPTTVEAGYPKSDYLFWIGMLAPSATPRAVIDRLNAEVRKALDTPDVKARLETLGAEPMTMAPAEFDAFLKSETARMAGVIKAAGIPLQ